MAAAISGFVGVVLGALITGASAWFLDERNQKRLLRTARRMLRMELDEACNFLEQSEVAGRWVAEPERVLSNEQWFDHRGIWGAHADTAAWEAVSRAFLAIAVLRRAHLGKGPGDSFDPAALPPAQEAINAALPFLPL